MKKFLSITVAFAIFALVGWKISQHVSTVEKDTSRRGATHAVAVEVAPVRTHSIRDLQIFTGTLKPKAHFIVAPKISGRLKKLFVNIGDQITHDQLIATLEDAEFAQQLDEARAELTVARANLEEQASSLASAQREFERIKALREKKIASESELDEAQAELEVKTAKHKVAMAQVSQKEAALKAAEVRLSYTQIKASWEDGDAPRVVGERFIDEGAMLTANSPIASIYDISSMMAVIFVIERDYPKVKIGQKAVVTTDAYQNNNFIGTIIRVAPVLKETSRQARVEIEIPNTDWLLKPGMFARVQIEFARHENATVVPIASLARRNDQQGIFIVDTETMSARFVPVTLGIVNGELAEVVNPPLSGLVITLGQHLLEDGAAIILPDNQQG
ncbi:MAG: efflux RND transporter periplasmic adaptor subunit [bacterium]